MFWRILSAIWFTIFIGHLIAYIWIVPAILINDGDIFKHKLIGNSCFSWICVGGIGLFWWLVLVKLKDERVELEEVDEVYLPEYDNYFPGNVKKILSENIECRK